VTSMVEMWKESRKENITRCTHINWHRRATLLLMVLGMAVAKPFSDISPFFWLQIVTVDSIRLPDVVVNGQVEHQVPQLHQVSTVYIYILIR